MKTGSGCEKGISIVQEGINPVPYALVSEFK